MYSEEKTKRCVIVANSLSDVQRSINTRTANGLSVSQTDRLLLWYHQKLLDAMCGIKHPKKADFFFKKIQIYFEMAKAEKQS